MLMLPYYATLITTLFIAIHSRHTPHAYYATYATLAIRRFHIFTLRCVTDDTLMLLLYVTPMLSLRQRYYAELIFRRDFDYD